MGVKPQGNTMIGPGKGICHGENAGVFWGDEGVNHKKAVQCSAGPKLVK